MALYKRGNTWWAKWTIGGRTLRRSTGTGIRGEAEKVFAELKVESGSETGGERMDSVFDAWVRAVRLEHQAHPATGRSYASAARRFSAAFGHHRPVRGIPDADIERFRTARLEAGISPTTVNHDLVRLATALRWAQRTGRYHGPLPTVRKIKVARRKIPKHLARANVARLIAAAEQDPKLRRALPFLHLAAFAGMRKSEIRWLTWGDVDMTNGWVHVVAKPGWTPKSGERAIALDSQLVDFLKAWREELAGKGIPTEAGDWVAPFMPTEAGLGARQVELGVQWTANRISYDIVAIFEASGVERPAGAAHRLHMLRGCYAVELLRSGTDLETLKELLGHADLKTTAAYLEASAESKRRAVSRLRAGE